MALKVTHTRVRWTSQSGVEFVPLEYGNFPASKGYTDIRYAYVDLSEYDIDLVVKPNFTVPRIAQDVGAELAINGPFAYITATNATPLGYYVRDGKLYNYGTSVPQWIDFILRKDGRAEIAQLNPDDISDVALAFSATPEIVRDGKIYVNVFGEKTPEDVYGSCRPRTGLGITADGRLLVVVADGDNPKYDAGLRVDHLAAIMIELGAVSAMNLDGGGSSVMCYNGEAISANKGTRRLGAAVVFNRKQSADTPEGYSYRVAHIAKRPNTRPGGAFKPEVLLIHTTNNFNVGATAEAHRRLLNTTADYVSYHLVTDDIETIELIPFTEPAYHAGDDGGYYTHHSIGHEICVNKLVNGKVHPQTYRNSVETSARIVAEYGVELREHRDVPERAWKNCTHKDVFDFAQFKADVLARVAELKGGKKLEENEEKPEEQTPIYRVKIDGKQIAALREKANIIRQLDAHLGTAEKIEIERV